MSFVFQSKVKVIVSFYFCRQDTDKVIGAVWLAYSACHVRDAFCEAFK
jgi:hypothetical protein